MGRVRDFANISDDLAASGVTAAPRGRRPYPGLPDQVTLRRIKIAEVHRMSNKLAQTQVHIHELIATRWSARAIDLQKSVSRTQLLALLEATRWATSSF